MYLFLQELYVGLVGAPCILVDEEMKMCQQTAFHFSIDCAQEKSGTGQQSDFCHERDQIAGDDWSCSKGIIATSLVQQIRV